MKDSSTTVGGVLVNVRVLVGKLLAGVYAVLALACLLPALSLLAAPGDLAGSSLIAVTFFAALGGWFGYLARRRWRSDAGGLLQPADLHDPSLREFFSSVAGVSRSNADGSDRQALIRAKCRAGGALTLVREPGNAHDANAIAVMCSGSQIGYLHAELAEKYAKRIDSGEIEMTAEVKEVTGGTTVKPTYGVNVLVRVRIDPP